MESVSKEDLQAKEARIAELRQQVADAETLRLAAAQEQSNMIKSNQLDDEISRLEAQLELAKKAINTQLDAVAPVDTSDNKAESKDDNKSTDDKNVTPSTPPVPGGTVSNGSPAPTNSNGTPGSTPGSDNK